MIKPSIVNKQFFLVRSSGFGTQETVSLEREAVIRYIELKQMVCSAAGTLV
jgi:hypothetical protein